MLKISVSIFLAQLNANVGYKKFRKINWIPKKERVEQHVTTNIFKKRNLM